MSKAIKVPGRAYTKKQKREVMRRLLAVWEQMPDQRFGQLIDNFNWVFDDLPFAEDFKLCERAEDFAIIKAGMSHSFPLPKAERSKKKAQRK